MKILVTVKRVIDYNVQVRVKADNSGVEKENVKMSMNPPDENAVEEALRIKEAGKADEIIILSVGEEKCQETKGKKDATTMPVSDEVKKTQKKNHGPRCSEPYGVTIKGILTPIGTSLTEDTMLLATAHTKMKMAAIGLWGELTMFSMSLAIV